MKRFTSCYNYIVECRICPQIFKGSRKHHPVFHRIFSRQQPVQCRNQILHLRFCQISKCSHIHSENRNIPSQELSGRKNQCPVTSDDKGAVACCLFRLFPVQNAAHTMTFQIRHRLLCHSMMFVFSTVCDNVNLFHLSILPVSQRPLSRHV